MKEYEKGILDALEEFKDGKLSITECFKKIDDFVDSERVGCIDWTVSHCEELINCGKEELISGMSDNDEIIRRAINDGIVHENPFYEGAIEGLDK
jgi:hypothetical protein